VRFYSSSCSPKCAVSCTTRVSLERDDKSLRCDTDHTSRYHLNNYRPKDPIYIEQTGCYKAYLDKYCTLAKELKISIIPGTIVERHPWVGDSRQSRAVVLTDEIGDFQLLNVAYFISAESGSLGR